MAERLSDERLDALADTAKHMTEHDWYGAVKVEELRALIREVQEARRPEVREAAEHYLANGERDDPQGNVQRKRAALKDYLRG